MTFATADDFRRAISKLDELLELANVGAYEPGSWPLIPLTKIRERMERELARLEGTAADKFSYR